MGRPFLVRLALLAFLVTACSPEDRSVSLVATGPSPPRSVAASPSGSPPERAPLPSGFPVLPGAVPGALPKDDPGLIGLWTTEQPGAAAYDFYVGALPAAGYRIVAAYPGGAAAVIRFRPPGGAIWQVVVHPGPAESVAMELRLDRP